MPRTPEGRVKEEVKKAFKALQAEGVLLYYHMPVQNGMGKPTLDFIGCINGKFFAVETKAPGKSPTARQWETINEMKAAGAHVTICDGTNMKVFIGWLQTLAY